MNPEELKMPESIRTPGRTWTKYPEIEYFEAKNPEISVEASGDVEVLRGDEAKQELGDRFMDSIKPEENKLTYLHSENLSSLVLVRAKGKGKVKIYYESVGTAFCHLVVQAEPNSELSITEEFDGEAELFTGFAEVHVGENAKVQYGSLENIDSDLGYFRRKAVVKDHGSINWLNGKFSGELSRTKIETVLKGNGSEAEKLATWYPIGEQHFDTSLHVRHIGENTRCQMDSRAVVDERSRSIYEGLQKVERPAKETSSFQNEEVITLSDEAEVDASPKLMIENPEVEASHAAGAGNIDDMKRHYIETRGLSEDSAQRLIVKGFFEPVLQEIDLPDLRESIRSAVMEKLDQKK